MVQTRFFFFSVCVFASLSAIAQSTVVDASARGRGVIERAGGRISFDEVRVRLFSGTSRQATIDLIGSKTWSYRGQWRQIRDDEFRVEVTDAYGDSRAFGRLTIRLDGNSVEFLDGDGRAANSDFDVSFERTNSGGTGGAAFNDLAEGNGDLNVLGRGDSFSRIRVVLNRDGSFTLSFTTDRTQTITGRWDSRQRGVYSLTVNGGSGNSYTSGRGELRATNEKVRSIDLRGSVSRGSFTLRFGAGSGGSDDNGGGGTGNNQGFGFNVAHTGRGSYALGSDGSEVRSSRVNLRSNGTFEIEVRGSRTNYFRGTWTARGDRADLDVREAFGKEATGSGSVILTNNRTNWRTFSVDGRSSGRSFRSSFVVGATTGGGNPRPPSDAEANNLLSMKSERKGTGEFVLSSNTNDIESLRLELKPNGEYSVSVMGEPTYLFSGRYRVTSNNRLTLTVTRGFGGTVTGSGTVVLASGSETFESVTLEGRWNNRPFAVRFRIKD